MKSFDSQDPKGLIHSCLGGPSHWLPAVQPLRWSAQPHNGSGGTCYRSPEVSTDYTSCLLDLPIPSHDYTGAAPGQGRST